MAQLARLSLSEGEVEAMREELSSVLDHIAKIGELDLEGVEPTAHVIDLNGALREDRLQPSLPREVALAGAPAADEQGFLVPSPQA